MSTPITPSPARQGTSALALGALGVVYGDIGTSPLYTVKEVFAPHTGVALNADNLIGACSALLWALMLVVTLKYVLLVLRADNRGEGGGLALTALAADATRARPALRRAVLLLGVFGATLFYGDSLITPAISVLGAMEGLQLVAPTLGAWAPAFSVAILVSLFLVQRFGTQAVGRAFGPVILLWFAVLGVSGALQIAEHPQILAALNPLRGWDFLLARGPLVLATVGALVLAITGAEALYADMGHFGRRPIQLAWTFVVLPGLALNYLGQGALLIGDPKALENPFYRLFPESWLLPVLVLATLAAIIASQAVISGAYSMTRQAMQLGFLPRMAVRFTSASESGQIYMPAVNAAMMVGVVVVVLAFGSSSALAGAYGIAVTLTMLITTLLAGVVVLQRRLVAPPLAVAGLAFFVGVDLALAAGCAVKLPDGGWFTLALAALLFFLMTTWWRGRALVLQSLGSDGLALQGFVDMLDPATMHRVPRTAVYPVADPASVPQALLHNLKHNQVLHEHNVVLTVVFDETPWVPESRRLELQPLGHGFWRATVRYGFMDTVDVPRALSLAAAQGLAVPVFETSYFLSRETVVPAPGGGMAELRERLFAVMTRHAGSVADFFRLPGNAVVELGTRVQI